METLLGQLWAAPAAPRKKHPPISRSPGVYLFTENGKPMYVGQSRNLRKRLGWHTRPKSRQNQATFAFALAKRAAEGAGVLPEGTRDDVADHEEFRPFFTDAKAKVAQMDVRFIELPDPHYRTVFEVYTALVYSVFADASAFSGRTGPYALNTPVSIHSFLNSVHQSTARPFLT
jgi:hypothetical protein